MWDRTGEGQGPRARVWSTIQEGVLRRLVNDPGESTLTKWEINILESNPLRFTCNFGKGSNTIRKMYRRDRGVPQNATDERVRLTEGANEGCWSVECSPT